MSRGGLKMSGSAQKRVEIDGSWPQMSGSAWEHSLVQPFTRQFLYFEVGVRLCVHFGCLLHFLDLPYSRLSEICVLVESIVY